MEATAVIMEPIIRFFKWELPEAGAGAFVGVLYTLTGVGVVCCTLPSSVREDIPSEGVPGILGFSDMREKNLFLSYRIPVKSRQGSG